MDIAVVSQSRPGAEHQGTTHRRSAHAQVLLVEDEPAHAELIMQTLGRIIPRVRHVKSGSEALAALGASAFDVILLDIGLPDVSGMTVLRWIHSQHLCTPVIVISKSDEIERVIQAMQLKAANYVVKAEGYVDNVVSAVAQALDGDQRRDDDAAGSLQRLASGVFVGRKRELELLRSGMSETRDGRGRLVLIGGEHGIGKTSLLQSAGAVAVQYGFRPLWGRCHDGGDAPSYWPWRQILRSYRAECRDEHRHADPADDALAGTAMWNVTSLWAPNAASGDGQFRVLDEVTMLLKRAARHQPLMLLLDDLQWADAGSQSLLRFVVREISDTPILLVATYALDPADDPVRAHLLAYLRQQPNADYIALRGLTQSEVQEQLAAIAGHSVPESLARVIFQRTDGTPLFVKELVHLLIEENLVYHDGERWICRVRHDQMPVPDSVCGIFDRRLTHASRACREGVLNPAAVVGREFALAVVERLSALSADAFRAAVSEAVGAGLIAPLTGIIDHYRFCHGLMRETVYERLAPDVRRAQHRAAAQAIEVLFDDDLSAHMAQLADHCHLAGSGVAADDAATYARQAGEQATAHLAHEEAVHYFDMALHHFERMSTPNHAERARLLVALSDALWRAGVFDRAREVALQAMDVARALGDAEQLAHAALAYAGRLTAFGVVACSENTLAFLDAALTALGDDGPIALRALLEARVAEETSLANTSTRRDYGRRAIQLARQSGDPAVLVQVLISTFWASWEPSELAHRAVVAAEVVAVANRLGDCALGLEGHVFTFVVALEAGDVVTVHRELDTCDRLAQELQQPYHQWIVASMRTCVALIEGRWSEAEALLPQALNLGQSAHNRNAALFFGVQLGHLHWLRGQTDLLVPLLSQLGTSAPLLNHVVRCVLAGLYCEQGRIVDARNELERLGANDFVDLPRDVTWAYSAAVLSEVCAFVGDLRRARVLYDELKPFARRVITLGPVVALGSASYCLATLAMALDDREAAAVHFVEALDIHERLGAPQWRARTQLAYARFLSQRGQDGDLGRARTLLLEVAQTATQLGIPALLATANALYDTLAAQTSAAAASAEPHVTAPASDAPHEAARNVVGVFRREGDVWTVGLDRKLVHVKDMIGLHRIAELLRHPGAPIPAITLASAAGPCPDEWPSSEAMHGEDLKVEDLYEEDASPDSRAVREYRQRLIDLAEELQNATRCGDTLKATRIRTEIERLTEHLASTWRRWKESPAARRARLRVTKSVGAAIDKIRVQHPQLGRHLAVNIKRGFICTYMPDPEHSVGWTF